MDHDAGVAAFDAYGDLAEVELLEGVDVFGA